MAKVTEVPTEILTMLSQAEIEDNILRLTSGQLDRKTYLAVNDVLEQMGGKWNRKAKGHVFNDDPTDLLEDVILTGTVDRKKDLAKEMGFFPTPLKVVTSLLEIADVQAHHTVLEPSAGQGAIADEVAKITPYISVCEILPDNVEVLRRKGYEVEAKDFLSLAPNPTYDRIIMNPPFAKQQDIQHVEHAFDFLKEGGRLVSIMSAGVTFRQDRRTTAFRELVETSGWVEHLPENSFRESGTNVNTVVVVLDK